MVRAEQNSRDGSENEGKRRNGRRWGKEKLTGTFVDFIIRYQSAFINGKNNEREGEEERKMLNDR